MTWQFNVRLVAITRIVLSDLRCNISIVHGWCLVGIGWWWRLYSRVSYDVSGLWMKEQAVIATLAAPHHKELTLTALES